MKKSKTMRAGGLLLALTLITSCFVGGTFSKYTTSTAGSDNARVAYWGFDQDASTTIDLFDGTYDNVKSADGDNVVAPGTSKTATFAFGYTGNTTENATAPEVAYTFKVTPDFKGSYSNLDSNTNFKWTLKKGSETATEYNTVADLVDALEALSGDASGTKKYNAGELPTAFTSADEIYTIGWKWEFYTSATQDETDTAMGNAQSLDNVELTLTISATQID